jgi:RTX calcium-binding nonapeptide repeat (4 copies)
VTRRIQFAPLLVTLMLFGAFAALPQAAGASTASLSGGVLTITAAPGEANAVVLSSGNANPIWVNDSAGVTPGAGCEASSTTTRVFCFLGPTGLDSASVVASLGDGNDSFAAADAGGYVSTVNVDGGPGDDTIAGGYGNDVLHGGDGNDDLGGSSGEDKVYGEAGDDTVRGHGGADTVSGGPGVDLIEGDGQGIYGNGGSDTIDSRDGERDRVTCGLGADALTADSLDVIETSECESVDTGAATPAPAPTPTPGTTPVASPVLKFVASPGTKLSKLRSKTGPTFRFSVSGACTAAVKLTVATAEAKRTKLGRSAVTLMRDTAAIAEAGTFEGTIKVAAKYRRKMRSLKRLKVTLALTCASAGKTTRISKTITFKR